MPRSTTLSQHAVTSYRTALTALTLMGGLPARVLAAVAERGWSGLAGATRCAFALLQIAICLPLHLAFIPRTVIPISRQDRFGI
jgi:hypothetical protein